jgi:hypothetical protein
MSSLIAVVNVEELHAISLAENFYVLNLPPNERQRSVLFDSEIFSADGSLNFVQQRLKLKRVCLHLKVATFS